MLKTGAILLSALLLAGGSVVFANSGESEREIRYYDTAAVTYNETAESGTVENVTINYTTRTVTPYSLAVRCPAYDYAPAIGACAAVGGGNLIGFYDRYDEDLIPNHTSGTPVGTTYIYSIQDAAVRTVIDSLYSYMGSSNGTTEAQFKNGIVNFCKDKGHTVTYTSCMQGSSFSYAKAQTYLKANQPIVLFLSGYNVADIVESSNKDSLTRYTSEANHIMIAFGYKIYVYDGTTYNYLSVSSGILGYASGLYNINYNTKINNALAVNIS
ncbi:MAG: hypothetical protein K2H43_01070 [Clostridia bacterium]|nr:hypothetical protein [Clostridia bacterium]